MRQKLWETALCCRHIWAWTDFNRDVFFHNLLNLIRTKVTTMPQTIRTEIDHLLILINLFLSLTTMQSDLESFILRPFKLLHELGEIARPRVSTKLNPHHTWLCRNSSDLIFNFDKIRVLDLHLLAIKYFYSIPLRLFIFVFNYRTNHSIVMMLVF